ncbi:MAG TPA: YciI family protein [Thermoanaerobaculia bacterium]|nr:YciI family protein [Thermoanaerobaculia bacterium]
MRYMMLIYTTEKTEAAASPEERNDVIEGHRAVMEATAGRGILQGAEPLAPTGAAKTVRLDGGRLVLTDGPFAETKEQLAGYYILDCRDIDEAVEWASKIPTACGGGTGCVEIRPLRWLGARWEEKRADRT